MTSTCMYTHTHTHTHTHSIPSCAATRTAGDYFDPHKQCTCLQGMSAFTQDVLNLISNPPSCRKWQYSRMTSNMLIMCIYWAWQQLIYKRSHCQKLHLEMKWGLFKLLMISYLLLLTPSHRVTGDQPYCCTECSLISLTLLRLTTYI